MDSFVDAVARVRVAAFAEDHETVEGLLEALLAWGPDAARVGRAALALDHGDALAALEWLTTAQIMQPDARAVSARLLAEAYLDNGQPAIALATLESLTDDDARVTRAKALFRLRRGDEALALVEDVLDRSPDHWEARLGRGVLWLAMGRLDDAVAALSEVASDNPLDPRPYRALAKVFLLTGAPERGIPLLTKLLDNRLLGSPAVAMDLAELYAAAGQTSALPEVLEAVTRTVRVGPPQALALATLWQEVPSSGAIRHVASAFPDHPVAEVLEGLALEVDGRDDDAVACFFRAGDLDHWLVHERLAAHLLGQGDRDAALVHLARAEALSPRMAAVRLTRAVASLDTAPEGALETLRMAASQPSFRPTVRRRAQLALDAYGA